MRIICFIITVLFTINIYAQDPILYEYDWRLETVHIDGQSYSPPVNEELPIVGLQFLNKGLSLETTVCNVASGELLFDDPNFTFTFVDGLTVTLIECENSDNSAFEGLYFGFFLNEINDTFTYEIIIIDEGLRGGGYILVITSESGNWATYYINYLPVQDNLALNYSLYPNPTEDELFISATTELDDFSITIYNILGELVFSKNNITSGDAINTQNFKSGIYFVSLIDNLGNKIIKKIVKR